MKILRKKMTLALAIILVLSVFTPSFSAVNMSDLNEVSWAKTTIEKWAGIGLVSGYADGTFKPGNAITRAEFTVIAYNAFELESTTRKAFDDVKTSDWFYQPVSQMAAQGFINGYGDGLFKPNAPITRAEAAIILVNIQGLKANPEAIGVFEDAGLIPPWAAGYIGAAVEAKNISGYPDGTFRASANITRAESVVMLDNAIYGENTYANNWILNEPAIYGSTTETTVVEGNVYVRSESISLNNFVIKGDLILGKEIAEGTVSLNSVTVEGDTEIYGGGMNSIYVRNSKLGNVMVLKANQLIRIVAVGNSTFGTLTAFSGVKLEESNTLSTGGFGEIIIEAGSTGQIIIEGNFSKVTIRATGVEVVVPKDTVIAELNIEARASVTGDGTIEQAIVDVNGVTFETAPSEVLAGTSTNVTVTIGGKATEVTQAPAPAPAPAPGGGGTVTPPVVTPTTDEYFFYVVKTENNITRNVLVSRETLSMTENIDMNLIDEKFDALTTVPALMEEYSAFINRAMLKQASSGNTYAFGLANRVKNYGLGLSVFNDGVAEMISDGNLSSDEITTLSLLVASEKVSDLYADVEKLYPNDTLPADIEISVFGNVNSTGVSLSDLDAQFFIGKELKDAVAEIVKIEIGGVTISFQITTAIK